MNKDFHYYATYLAARVAGFEYEPALTIAYAAQFVDDFTQDKANLLKRKASNICPTVQTLYTMGKSNSVGWSNVNVINSLKIWTAFHFLPGNYTEDNNLKRQYAGENQVIPSVINDIWTYYMNPKDPTNARIDNSFEREQFKCLCLPDSILAKAIVDNLKNEIHKEPENPIENFYEFIGLTMHVLADTWAHCYFSGTHAWFINSGKLDKWTFIPDIFSFNSYAYLGHAQAKHVPDRPYDTYTYTPQWNSKGAEIQKDNTEDFIKAFKQIAYAMRCFINPKLEFVTGIYSTNGIDQEFDETLQNIEATLRDVFKTRCKDSEPYQCEIWEKAFSQNKFIGLQNVTIRNPIKYNETFWVNELQAAGDSHNLYSKTRIYKFNQSANEHLEFVEKKLAEVNVYLGEVPTQRRELVTLKHVKSDCYLSNGLKVHSNKSVFFEIIKTTSNRLKSGDVIQLETTEYDYIVETPTGYSVVEKDINKDKYVTLESLGRYDDLLYSLPELGDDATGKTGYKAFRYGTGIQNWIIYKFNPETGIVYNEDGEDPENVIDNADQILLQSCGFKETNFLVPHFPGTNKVVTFQIDTKDVKNLKFAAWRISIFVKPNSVLHETNYV